ncbi:MAG: hypothetical protein OK455_01120 [Thaumarchaeota archaeon]|nr:hypothetical protein [Nitrososphaerota archaeon]
MDRAALLDFLAVLVVALLVAVCSLEPLITGNYDETTFIVSIALPLGLGSAILSFKSKRVILFAFLAYIWAALDDAPVFFDSILTWPEVTRFHPFLPRLFMNIVIHGLTIIFMYLALRQSMKWTSVKLREAVGVIALTSVAFVLAYAQNIPLAAIQNLVETYWFQFDIAEKLASIFFFYLAVREAKKLRPYTETSGPSRP